MKTVIKLNKTEISEAIKAYVESKTNHSFVGLGIIHYHYSIPDSTSMEVVVTDHLKDSEPSNSSSD